MQFREILAREYQASKESFSRITDDIGLDRQRVADFLASGNGLTIREIEILLSYLDYRLVRNS